jgi:putative transposase
MPSTHPNHPPRIVPFDRYDLPIYFITATTANRRKLLNQDWLHEAFVDYWSQRVEMGLACGRYVMMPEHIHFFLRIDPSRLRLGTTVGMMKRSLSATLNRHGVDGPHWQPSFFDHLVRSDEQLQIKRDYVVYNPVKAGYVPIPNDWAYKGCVGELLF